ncbi:MAG TPA: biotin--[acetyl-CoA-carboxylase] ligase [bacterium]|jgi:BirA family biotin operon repressor/biotin-[acetyl-CoA-carboxylase] ligase
MMRAADLSAEEVARRLETVRFGRVLRLHDAVTSTNDVARQLASSGAAEGTAVIAREQRSGRGRLGRAWLSPRGGLWMSVVFRPALPVGDWPLLGFVLALAACSAIDAATGLRTGVKWPNDIMIRSRKLGGVLVEGTGAFAIGGVGINANVALEAFEPAMQHTVTSLQAITGRPLDLAGLAAGLLLSLEQYYPRLQTDRTWILDEWRRRSVALGRAVHVIGATTFDGVVEGLDESGALLVRTADGVKAVSAGEVSIRLRSGEPLEK